MHRYKAFYRKTKPIPQFVNLNGRKCSEDDKNSGEFCRVINDKPPYEVVYFFRSAQSEK